MNLTPREKDKLVIALAALVARTVGVMPYAIDAESPARLLELERAALETQTQARLLLSLNIGLPGLERKAR